MYFLNEKAFGLNGVKWLKEHFPLQKDYEWIDVGYYKNSVAFQMFNCVKGDAEPWIDLALTESSLYKKLKESIEFVNFDSFIINDPMIIKEIQQMQIPVEAYMICLSSYVKDKEHLSNAKIIKHFLVLTDDLITPEIDKKLINYYGYKYEGPKGIRKDKSFDILYFYSHDNPIEYYTLFKLQENNI